jgi:hypothetical protein
MNEKKVSIEHKNGTIFVMTGNMITELDLHEARALRNELNNSIDNCCYDYNKKQNNDSIGE